MAIHVFGAHPAFAFRSDKLFAIDGKNVHLDSFIVPPGLRIGKDLMHFDAALLKQPQNRGCHHLLDEVSQTIAKVPNQLAHLFDFVIRLLHFAIGFLHFAIGFLHFAIGLAHLAIGLLK